MQVDRLAFEGQGFTYSEGGTHEETLQPQRNLKGKNRGQGGGLSHNQTGCGLQD